jgi:LmbE family N-acetylglucosaminyl deacetylase
VDTKKVALGFCAHPDDVEFMCAGTLALLHKDGWQIHIASMAPGDCGTMELTAAQISKVRKKEAAASAKLLGGKYYCAESRDVFITYDKPTILKTVKVIRQTQPTIVFAPSPDDYMIDHEITSQLVRTACFVAGIPNIKTPGAKPFGHTPHLYYADPVEAKDKFGTHIKPSFYVDITSVINVKEKMLCCHASQREWLRAYHGMDEYVMTMKRLGVLRGEEINVKYAEGFRQHLGHAYPQDNILKAELGKLVHNI